MKRWGIALTMLIGFGFVYAMPGAAHAQSAGWVAWIVDDGNIWSVNRHREIVERYRLPPLRSGATSGYNMIVLSYSGRYATYFDASTDDWAYQVYDSVAERIVVEHEVTSKVWEAVLFEPGVHIYDQDERRVAFGYTEYNPAVPAEESIGPWHLLVYDLHTGVLLHELESGDFGDVFDCPTCTPLPRELAGSSLRFSLTRLGMEDTITSFSWGMETHEVERAGQYDTFDFDRLRTTGEIVYTRFNPRFSTSDAPTEGGHAPNAVYIYDPDVGCFPIFASENALFDPALIEGGRFVIVYGGASYDAREHEYVIARSGTVVYERGVFPFSGLLYVEGTNEGYLMVVQPEHQHHRQFYPIVTENGLSTDERWPIGIGDTPAYVSHVMYHVDVPALDAWKPLADGTCDDA